MHKYNTSTYTYIQVQKIVKFRFFFDKRSKKVNQFVHVIDKFMEYSVKKKKKKKNNRI